MVDTDKLENCDVLVVNMSDITNKQAKGFHALFKESNKFDQKPHAIVARNSWGNTLSKFILISEQILEK